MRTSSTTAALCRAAAACILLAAAPPAHAQEPPRPTSVLTAPVPTLPEPIATRQTLFAIPFTLPPTTDPAQELVEVQLFVSADQGANWAMAGRVDAKQKSITFRAQQDGEYWFFIRTIDRNGHKRPENTPVPELRVIVYTQQTRLEHSAARGAAGQIVVRWQASDPLLKPASLKIEYQAASDPAWHPVPVETPQGDPSRTTFSGDVPFTPQSAGNVTIRAEISDRAGNTTVMQTTVLDPTAGDHRALGAPPASFGGGAAWPADRTTDQPLGHGADGPALGQASGIDTARGWNPPSSNPIVPPTVPPTVPTTGQINPPIENRFVPDQAGSPFTQGMPRGERPYMVNSARFALDYEVESVGPAGVSKIEIWGTRDGGRTWQSYGVEPNSHKPIKVRVDGEGLYGFRITVQDGNGFGARPPRSGDLPELWVGVDLTKPAVRITGVELGAGPHAGELAIRWEATDSLLATRPVTLSFAEHPGGPYSTIAAGLENTGAYAWRFDNRVPDRIFVRLEVRDEAGNIGVFETPDPVALDPGRPQGHLRTVRPLGDDPSSRAQSYEFYR